MSSGNAGDPIVEAIAGKARTLRVATIIQRGAFVVVAGGIATIAQFLDWKDGSPSSSQIVGIAASLVALLCGAILLFVEQDAGEHLALAYREQAKAKETERKLNDVLLRLDRQDASEREIEIMTQFFVAIDVMRNLIATSATTTGIDDDALAQSFMKRSGRQLGIAADFALTDCWTICIYRPFTDAGKVVLKCVADNRALPCDPEHARSWPIDKGVLGMTWTSGRPTKIPNMQAPEMKALIESGTVANASDDDRYRSMVAFPVMVPGEAQPWGVVSATNDRADHFNHDDQVGLKSDEPIRMLADFLGIALSVRPDRSCGP